MARHIEKIREPWRRSSRQGTHSDHHQGDEPPVKSANSERCRRHEETPRAAPAGLQGQDHRQVTSETLISQPMASYAGVQQQLIPAGAQHHAQSGLRLGCRQSRAAWPGPIPWRRSCASTPREWRQCGSRQVLSRGLGGRRRTSAGSLQVAFPATAPGLTTLMNSPRSQGASDMRRPAACQRPRRREQG